MSSCYGYNSNKSNMLNIRIYNKSELCQMSARKYNSMLTNKCEYGWSTTRSYITLSTIAKYLTTERSGDVLILFAINMLLGGLTGRGRQHSLLSLFAASFLLIATCAGQSPVRTNGASNVWTKHGNYVAFQASTFNSLH